MIMRRLPPKMTRAATLVPDTTQSRADYLGFPAHTYVIQYPAPGAPALADRVQQLLQTAGLPIVQDSQRGFDHGAFVPAYVMYPDADVPMVQLSIDEIGRAHV